jgi:SH3-like domain-containing protein
MYTEANTASQPVMMLRPHTPLTTIEEQGEWIYVQNEYGLTGWVRKALLARATP